MKATDEWYSIEQVAERLGLHVRTVRNYVRDGRLGAVRIGKQYRVSRADLEALTGRSGAVLERERRVEATSVVDIDGIGAAAAERLAALVTSLPAGGQAGGRAPHVDVVHEPGHGRLKVVVVGPVEATAELLRFVGAMAEERV